MELKLEHLAPYLPYGLLGKINDTDSTITLGVETSNFHFTWSIIMFLGDRPPIKPLLRPLSQIQSHFEPLWDSDIDVRTYLSEEYIASFGFESIEEILKHKVEWWPVGFYTTLLKHHFDVFGLIENELATIKE